MSAAARESWLLAAFELMRPWFDTVGRPLPVRIRVSVGFGPSGARAENKTILGVCLSTHASADKVNEIWISPEDADAVSMLATMVHELIHAALDVGEKPHGADFAEAAGRLGLEGKMTATVPGLGLLIRLKDLSEELGPYPGSAVDLSWLGQKDGERASSGPEKQKNRHGLLVCGDSTDVGCECGGYQVRTTKKWLSVGYPACPFGGAMIEKEQSE